jgi:hypothetical protein
MLQLNFEDCPLVEFLLAWGMSILLSVRCPLIGWVYQYFYSKKVIRHIQLDLGTMAQPFWHIQLTFTAGDTGGCQLSLGPKTGSPNWSKRNPVITPFRQHGDPADKLPSWLGFCKSHNIRTQQKTLVKQKWYIWDKAWQGQNTQITFMVKSPQMQCDPPLLHLCLSFSQFYSHMGYLFSQSREE